MSQSKNVSPRKLDRFFKRALLKEFPFLSGIWNTNVDEDTSFSVRRCIRHDTTFVYHCGDRLVRLFDETGMIHQMRIDRGSPFERADLYAVKLIDLLDQYRGTKYVLVLSETASEGFSFVLYKRADEIIPPLEQAAELAASSLRREFE